MRVRIVHGLAAVLLAHATLAAHRPAWAGPPSDQLRLQVERVVRVLKDPDLKREERLTERRAAIRRIAQEIFDFTETTRRALGQHWQARTAQERQEIVGLYTDLLERSYIGKIELYSGERIQFVGDTIDGNQATVRTRLVTKAGTEIPVDYRMHRVGGDRWLAYDVAIEGVSMVANYRAQFNKIIQTSGYKSLVSKLAAKQEEGLVADRELGVGKASQTK
jgi:phospholipid transport system substrate-binding protein